MHHFGSEAAYNLQQEKLVTTVPQKCVEVSENENT